MYLTLHRGGITVTKCSLSFKYKFLSVLDVKHRKLDFYSFLWVLSLIYLMVVNCFVHLLSDKGAQLCKTCRTSYITTVLPIF